MVYLHGGGYTGSANIQYPGHFQAGFDVKVVVPNYRVDALGMRQSSLFHNDLFKCEFLVIQNRQCLAFPGYRRSEIFHT